MAEYTIVISYHISCSQMGLFCNPFSVYPFEHVRPVRFKGLLDAQYNCAIWFAQYIDGSS